MKLLVIGKEGRLQKYTRDTSVYEQFEICYVPTGSPDEEILTAGQDADFILADAVAVVSANVIEQMPKLKMIHSEGVGFNGIDVEAAAKRGIYVCNSKGMNATAVAEQAILLMLGLLRDVCGGDRAVRAGSQIQVKEQVMITASLKELGDCTIGLVGLGDIGKATAKMAAVFGAKVHYYELRPLDAETEAEYGVTYMPLDELLASSDIVSLHVPVTKDTMGMADETFFAKMKPGSYLINTARGELVDDEALLQAIRSGHLAGAGLDTLSNEPVRPDHKMLQAEPQVAEKILYSCHIGGVTASSFRRGYDMIWEDIRLAAAGQRPKRIVNGI